jgi:hypothetical protein
MNSLCYALYMQVVTLELSAEEQGASTVKEAVVPGGA